MQGHGCLILHQASKTLSRVLLTCTHERPCAYACAGVCKYSYFRRLEATRTP